MFLLKQLWRGDPLREVALLKNQKPRTPDLCARELASPWRPPAQPASDASWVEGLDEVLVAYEMSGLSGLEKAGLDSESAWWVCLGCSSPWQED